MFKKIVPSLLSGNFICPVSDPDGFAFLGDKAHAVAVNDYLERIDLNLAVTRQGGAFFVAHANTGGPERKAAKEVFSEIKLTLRPIVNFLDLVMRAMQSDEILMGGTLIEVNPLMAAIDANPSFRNDLQTLVNLLNLTSDGSDRSRLVKILKTLATKGYLVLQDKSRETYRVTGKIEFILEVIEFLTEHDSISLDEPGEAMDQQEAVA